jgi:hypothetical protein
VSLNVLGGGWAPLPIPYAAYGIGDHRLGDAAHRARRQFLDHETRVEPSAYRGGDQDIGLMHTREVLDAGGQVDGVADDGELQ